MKTFLAIFTCAEFSENHHEWMKLSQEMQKSRQEEGMSALNEWNAKYKECIVYDGGPLGELTKQVDRKGLRDIPSKVGHFIVVKTNTHEEAANMFLKHPHFAIFPGDAIEITECTQRDV